MGDKPKAVVVKVGTNPLKRAWNSIVNTKKENDPNKASRQFLGKPRRFWLISIIIVVICLLALVVYLLIIKTPPRKSTSVQNKQVTPKQAAGQLIDQLKKDQKTQEQTPVSVYKGLQNKIATNNIGKEQGEQFNTYSQAAIIGARIKDVNTKDYAKKALTLASNDEYFRAYNAGLLSRLEAISKGDYSVVE